LGTGTMIRREIMPRSRDSKDRPARKLQRVSLFVMSIEVCSEAGWVGTEDENLAVAAEKFMNFFRFHLFCPSAREKQK
jgi:hypothetical protein